MTPHTPTGNRQQQQQDPNTSTSTGKSETPTPIAHRGSLHIRPTQTPTTATPSSVTKHRHIKRIAPPALLPPVLDRSNSALHLSLNSEAGSTLSTQVDELLSRHLAAGGGGTKVHVSPGNPVAGKSKTEDTQQASAVTCSLPSTPPALPPKPVTLAAEGTTSAGPRKMASPQLSQPRRPLPMPPSQHPAPHQYPATYGPSVSKIRSFPTDPPSRQQDLPPGAAHMPSAFAPGRPGLGYGYPHPNFASTPHADYRDINAGQQQQSTISRNFAKGGASIMLHKGFFDLLSISQSNAPGNAAITSGIEFGQGWLGDKPTIPPAGRAVTTPLYAAKNAPASVPQAKGFRRISVDMIGKPTGFA